MGNTIGIIGARSGSKSVKDKNIALLAGYPLIAYSVVAAKLSKKISRVILSTDSKEYIDIASRYGAEALFVRPPEISTDTSTDTEFMMHAMQWFQDNESQVPEYWVHLRPTTPLRNPMLMDQAIEQFEGSYSANCLRSAHKSPESPLKWFQINDEGYFKGLTEKVKNSEDLNLPKELFPDAYIPDGYIDVVKASHVIETNTLHGENIMSYVSPFTIEVDSPEELDLLGYFIKRDGSPLLDYLIKHFPKG